MPMSDAWIAAWREAKWALDEVENKRMGALERGRREEMAPWWCFSLRLRARLFEDMRRAAITAVRECQRALEERREAIEMKAHRRLMQAWEEGGNAKTEALPPSRQ